MKGTRQAEILRIISEVEVETQEQLLEELAKSGIRATQATISRDIKQLQSRQLRWICPRPSRP